MSWNTSGILGRTWVELTTAWPVFEEAELPGWLTRHDLSSAATKRTSGAGVLTDPPPE